LDHGLRFSNCVLSAQTSSHICAALDTLTRIPQNDQFLAMSRPVPKDFSVPHLTSGQTYCWAESHIFNA
jgi:hypothetical protein